MSRLFAFLLAGVLVVGLSATAQEQSDYDELSRLIRGFVVKGAPKVFEEKSEWGKSTPIPEKLRLPNLPRTAIKVGDRVELAHGNWKRAKMWFDDMSATIVPEPSSIALVLTGLFGLVAIARKRRV